MLAGWAIRNSREWEHTRLLAYMQASINRDPKKSFPSLTEFMPLPTDQKIDVDAEVARMQKVMDDYKEQLKKANV